MIINANLIQLATQKEFRHVFGSLCRWLQILNLYEWNIEEPIFIGTPDEVLEFISKEGEE